MRVLLILGQRTGMTGSGVFTTNLSSGLAAAGHDVAVLSADGGRDIVPGIMRYDVPFTETFRVAGMSDTMPYVTQRFRDFSFEDFAEYSRHWRTNIARAIHDFAPDVVHVNHYWILLPLALQAVTCRVVVTVHGTDLEQWQCAPNVLNWARIRECSPAVVHTVSPYATQQYLSARATAFDHSIVMVPPPVRDDVFGPHSDQRDAFRALYVGKLSERKGLPYVLRAFASVKRQISLATLDVIGSADSNDLGHWHDECCAHDIPLASIRFLGHLDQETLARAYQSASLLVVGSPSESFALVVIEALISGCRVVMPAYGAADAVLNGEAMDPYLRTVPPLRDPGGAVHYCRDLASAWSRVLGSPAVPSEITRDLHRRFSRRTIANEMITRAYLT